MDKQQTAFKPDEPQHTATKKAIEERQKIKIEGPKPLTKQIYLSYSFLKNLFHQSLSSGFGMAGGIAFSTSSALPYGSGCSTPSSGSAITSGGSYG